MNSPVSTRRCEFQNKHENYSKRIDSLVKNAEQDGISLNSDSLADFWKFIKSHSDIRNGSLVLLDNGNLRSGWKDGQGTRFGVQFLGKDMVQYVIFKHRKAAQKVSRIAGRGTMDSIDRQIRTFDLESLLHE